MHSNAYHVLLKKKKNWSEYDLTGWQFGINLGMYLANKNSAAFLQWPARQRKQYSLHFKKNYYWYNEIKQELNGRDILKFPNTQKPEWTAPAINGQASIT